MRLSRLTPDQARAVGEQLAHAAAMLRRVVDAFREVARRLNEAIRPLVDYLRRCGVLEEPAGRAGRAGRRPRPTTRTGDRPAWASPYGPAPTGHR
ncbi:hypothetical protein [[Kitasatospora] papulosa]|uniref:hypothetical protein n=1 Tax=[Kitasatospora] papulosa TaxID=1464011 RepID=UPI00367AE396